MTRKYKWTIVKNKLYIPEFEDFDRLKFEEKDADFIKAFSQSTDTLIYCKYLDGKPSLFILDIERKVAKKWGIIMEYITGDCTGEYDYRKKECEAKNENLYKYMNEKYGENWLVKFDKEVADEVKATNK